MSKLLKQIKLEGVAPELRRRGLLRTEYEDTTLRENLGLKKLKPLTSKDVPHPVLQAGSHPALPYCGQSRLSAVQWHG